MLNYAPAHSGFHLKGMTMKIPKIHRLYSTYEVCPECRGADVVQDAGPSRYCRCDVHKVFWYAGSGVYKPCPTEDELEAIWTEEGYRKIQPALSMAEL